MVAVMAVGTLSLSSSASAAFPNFSGCPRSQSIYCLDIQSTTGSMTIKGFTVPLGASIEIRGGIGDDGAGGARFVPPSGTNGFFAKPVEVPGGILGIDLPISLNDVEATAQLAGPASSLRVDPTTLTVRMPLKLTLSNPLIGPACRIGTDSDPAWVTLIVGSTAPPPPNRSISGVVGTDSSPAPGTEVLSGNRNVDNSFSIPGASLCGLGLGLFNTIIDAKLKLPSSGGNNTLIVNNNLALQVA
ncbi:MAG TPA: hypothetical protein VGM91_00590 [Conexibacter sp.]|jgi:hypothetical protein